VHLLHLKLLKNCCTQISHWRTRTENLSIVDMLSDPAQVHLLVKSNYVTRPLLDVLITPLILQVHCLCVPAHTHPSTRFFWHMTCFVSECQCINICVVFLHNLRNHSQTRHYPCAIITREPQTKYLTSSRQSLLPNTPQIYPVHIIINPSHLSCHGPVTYLSICFVYERCEALEVVCRNTNWGGAYGVATVNRID